MAAAPSSQQPTRTITGVRRCRLILIISWNRSCHELISGYGYLLLQAFCFTKGRCEIPLVERFRVALLPEARRRYYFVSFPKTLRALRIEVPGQTKPILGEDSLFRAMKWLLFVLALLVWSVACTKITPAERKVSREIFETQSRRKSECCERKSLGGARV